MKRREFLENGLKAFAGSALALSHWDYLSAQDEMDLSQIVEERKNHPLYFDGMTFFGYDKEWIKKSGLSGVVWDVSRVESIDGKFVRRMIPCLKSIAQANKFLGENEKGLFLATKGSQIKDARKTGRTAVFLQFQDTNAISEDLEMMDVFYELGLRVLQFTHHYSNSFAGGCLVKEEEWTGLTELGFKAVEKMNKLGIVPDISHGNENLVLDVVKASKKPVIISHTGCRALVNNARCVTDSAIKAVSDSGGMIGIFSMSFWLTEDPVPTVDSYIKQIDHVIKVGGIDAVGISNDYDVVGQVGAAKLNNNNAEAIKGYFPWWKQHKGILGFDELPKHCVIPELNNVKRFYTIQAALEKSGHTTDQVEKIMGGNWIRVLTECLG